MLLRVSTGARVVSAVLVVAIVTITGVVIGGCPGPSGEAGAGVGPTHPPAAGADSANAARSGGNNGGSGEQSIAELYPFEKLTTREMFNQRVIKADKPVVVIFVSETCAVCKRVGKQIVELSKEFEDSVDFFAVEKRPGVELVLKMKVHSFPHVFLFFKGQKVQEYRGLKVEELKAELHRILGAKP